MILKMTKRDNIKINLSIEKMKIQINKIQKIARKMMIPIMMRMRIVKNKNMNIIMKIKILWSKVNMEVMMIVEVEVKIEEARKKVTDKNQINLRNKIIS